MKNLRLHPAFLVATAMMLALLAAARAEENTSTIKFSDPAKPGTLKVQLARGTLRIRGADTDAISVKSEAKPATKAPRKDGLRVLTASSSFALSEKDNVVTLDAASDGWHGAGSDFTLSIPRTTNVIVSNSWGGDIFCANLAGDLEINCLNGEVKLERISGGAVVNTMNGEIHASVLALHANKPLSFTSMNGAVVLRVPAETKASVRLRTQNGSILTDFDESALVTKTETSPRTSSRRGSRSVTVGGLPPEAREAIREATRVAVQVGREAAEAVREGIEASRGKIEEAHAKAEAAREKARAARERADTGRHEVEAPRAPDAPDAADAPPMPPIPPVPAIPTITGGKLVSGTLNGGGPEISVATMNGDVTLRQLEAKK